MTRLLNQLIFVMMTFLLAACGGGGGSAGTPSGSANPSNFKVNAPAEVALAIGQKATYSISGGLSPYQLNNSAPNVVNAVVSAGTLEVTTLRVGSAVLTLSPTGGGASFSIAVTVASSANSLQVQAPENVTLRTGKQGTYNILGGAPPYRVVSSAAGVASATLSAVGDALVVTANAPGSALVEVYDSSTSAPITRTVTVVTTAAFFSSAPATLSMAIGSSSKSFTVSGGVADYFVSSSNPAVADASLSNGTLTIVPQTTNGTANIVLKDSGGSIITVVVTVGKDVKFFTSAPDDVTIQGGSKREFTVAGGIPPYSASSSNTNIVTVSPAATSSGPIIFTAQNKGDATVLLRDSVGDFKSINVKVDQSGSFAVSAIELTTTLTSIRSAGDEATITALVKGASNVGVPNAEISFKASSGILLAPDAQTNASGIAKVKLAPGSDRSNRNIELTASVGALVSQPLIVKVEGTKLSISGPPALTVASTPPISADIKTYTVKAIDSATNAIPSVSVKLTSSLGNKLSPSSAITDSNGEAKFEYTPEKSGKDYLSAEGLGFITSSPPQIDERHVVSISATAFNFVSPTPAESTPFSVGQTVDCSPTVLLPNCRPQFRIKLLIDGVATNGRTVVFSTTRGTVRNPDPAAVLPSSGSSVSATTRNVTGEDGIAFVTLESPSAGVAQVTAQVNRVPTDKGDGLILGTADRSVLFTGVKPAKVRVQINPGAIPPNAAGSTTNRTDVTATVTDASDNPVGGRQVSFLLNTDPSNGSLSPGIAVTDASGIAKVQYISGQQSSPANGVSITATVAPILGDIPAAISNSPPATLTVNGNSLFIAINFGNTIQNLDPTTYSVPFSAVVTDANGLSVPSQILTLSVIPTRYYKGVMTKGVTEWIFVKRPTNGCPNEDRNNNGVLDFVIDEDRNNNGVLDLAEDVNGNGVIDAGEDKNGNGVLDPTEDSNGNGVLDVLEDTNQDGRLTPGNVVFVSPGTVTTDVQGLAKFNLTYGEQFGGWLEVNIVARTLVAGTESRREQVFVLPVATADLALDGTPAGVNSPFGTALAPVGGALGSECFLPN